MLKIGDKMMSDMSLTCVAGHVQEKIGCTTYYINHEGGRQSTSYAVTVGTAIAYDMGVFIDKAFKIDGCEYSPVYLATLDGLYEWRDGVWKEISETFQHTPLYQVYLNKEKKIKYVNRPDQRIRAMRCGWKIGDIIRGVYHNDYGITNEEMLEGEIVSIQNYDDNVFTVKILTHVDRSSVGGEFEVMYHSHRLNSSNFELVRRCEDA